MFNFVYKGCNSVGELVEGMVEVVNVGFVVDVLFGVGVILLLIEECVSVGNGLNINLFVLCIGYIDIFLFIC